MRKILFSLLAVVSTAFIAITATNAYLSDQETSMGNSLVAGTWVVLTPAEIVINELMVNPSGDESIGEWVELYNKGGSSIDLDGWYLYDAIDSHALEITSANVTGGSTTISAGGHLVVNRNGDADFSLNNGSDTVRLFNGAIGSGSLIDSIAYLSNTIEDMTWAKIPNGMGVWLINRTPTPGGPNV